MHCWINQGFSNTCTWNYMVQIHAHENRCIMKFMCINLIHANSCKPAACAWIKSYIICLFALESHLKYTTDRHQSLRKYTDPPGRTLPQITSTCPAVSWLSLSIFGFRFVINYHILIIPPGTPGFHVAWHSKFYTQIIKAFKAFSDKFSNGEINLLPSLKKPFHIDPCKWNEPRLNPS